MVGINTYLISLMDARKLKDAMADVVAKQLVAASQLLVQEAPHLLEVLVVACVPLTFDS